MIANTQASRVDIRISALESTLQRLIAGAHFQVQRLRGRDSYDAVHRASNGRVTFELISGKPHFEFVVTLQDVGKWRFRIGRGSPPFTKAEERLFGRLPKILLMAFGGNADEHDQPSQLGALLALDHLLVAQVLRRDISGGLWTPLLILQALIDLTFVRYEGSKATSGVVYTSQPEMFLDALDATAYGFGPFAEPHPFERAFFQTPTSYRYVDGRNAFYLVDNHRRVWGVLRAQQPEKYHLIDRCAGVHLQPLIHKMPGRVWCAFIGLNDDVQVRTGQGLALSWQANHWKVRDEAILRNLFEEAGVISEIAELLARTVHAMSELRKGALLLIPTDEKRLPGTIGQIDTSALASLLSAQLEQTTFDSICRTNAAVQVLSSDGITILARAGHLLACGRIIDLTGVTGGSGGGRTQAATAASHFGLAVKVSADGPISVFRDGVRVLNL